MRPNLSMSFFGFDTSLPGRDDDRFREGPTLGSLGGFEYEDEFELPGEEGDIQDYLATEEEADAANLDTFGELATPPDASGRDDGRVSQSERVQKIGRSTERGPGTFSS